MGNADKFVVGGKTYDVLSPATFGGYIETIGAACVKPNGYAVNKLFLAYDEEVQKLFKVTSAIAYGAVITKNTNCVETTMSDELSNATSAAGVAYDNSESGLDADNVQEAIDSLKSDLSNKYDKSGGILSGNVSVEKTATGYTSSEVWAKQNNSSTGMNYAMIKADQEGGNLRLCKGGGTALAEMDTNTMNGSSGYLRLYLGNSGTENVKEFRFYENGSFADGNGVNTRYLYSFMPVFGATSYSQGAIANALLVDTSNAFGDNNRVGYVYSGYTSSIPEDCIQGIREVFLYNSSNVCIKITGKTTDGGYGEWGNNWNGSYWSGWSRLNPIKATMSYNKFTASAGRHDTWYCNAQWNIVANVSNNRYLALVNLSAVKNADIGDTSFEVLATSGLVPSGLSLVTNVYPDQYVPLDSKPNTYDIQYGSYAKILTDGNIQFGRMYDTSGSKGDILNKDIPLGEYIFKYYQIVTVS